MSGSRITNTNSLFFRHRLLENRAIHLPYVGVGQEVHHNPRTATLRYLPLSTLVPPRHLGESEPYILPSFRRIQPLWLLYHMT